MWIKICGICNLDAAKIIAEAQPDAIGLNFYEPSPRHVTVETAQQIVALLPKSILPIGLFVNHEQSEILGTVKSLGLSTIQLHGDESPKFLRELLQQKSELKIIKAFRMNENGWQKLENYLEECQQLGVTLFASLLDAYSPQSYGGTGEKISWNQIPIKYRFNDWPPLILAGGLTPENLAEAIQTAQPWGIDVASGVESSPSIKDKTQIKRFLHAARAEKNSPED